jgi:ubiquinone/menaquinone biosynthesis C-methylase UbiE
LNEPLPIEDNSADTIVCLSVLEHLKEPQPFLNEAFRILKPDNLPVDGVIARLAVAGAISASTYALYLYMFEFDFIQMIKR